MKVRGQSTAVVNQISFENLCHQINRLKLMSLQQDVILKCVSRWPHNLSTSTSELQREFSGVSRNTAIEIEERTHRRACLFKKS